MGDTAYDCAQALAEAGACAVGANCGSLDPVEMAAVVATMREATPLPLIAQPNAGKARMVDKQAVYDMSPDDFAAGIRECARAGAKLLGGCCGTSPAHVRAMVACSVALDGWRAAGRRGLDPVTVATFVGDDAVGRARRRRPVLLCVHAVRGNEVAPLQ